MRLMMVSAAVLAWTGCLASAVAAPPQHSPDDLVRAVRDLPCADGEPRGDDGTCPPVASQSKGFSLFADKPSAPRPSLSGAKTTGRRVAGPPRRSASVVPPRQSPLSDLLITFKLGSADLTDQGKTEADSFAEALGRLPKTRFEIAGYTDVSGSPSRNVTLSQSRAEAVKAYLVSRGVDGGRLEAKGYGSRDLAVPARPTSPANRRVEARALN
jgi:outer membrane protein OmpA-like peptidoglycan-associated protein